MERRKFEDSFKEAFQHAEVNPSENVWTNIELDLEKAEGDKMKRRLVFFKMLAAACVIFAMTVAGIGYFALTNADHDNLAHQPNSNVSSGQKADSNEMNASQEQARPSNDVEERETAADASSAPGNQNGDVIATESPGTVSSPSGSSSLALSEAAQRNNDKIGNTNDTATEDAVTKKGLDANNNIAINRSNKERVAVVPSSKNTSVNSLPGGDNEKSITRIRAIDEHPALTEKNNGAVTTTDEVQPKQERKLPLFYEPKRPELQFPQSTADPGMLLLAKLDAEQKQYAREEKSQKKNNAEKLWTSVGFAAGAVDSNNPSVSPVYTNSAYPLNASNTAAKQSKASGTAYSVGVSVGTRLSERWVLQGGVNYLTQSSDYTANGVIVGNNFEAPKAESLNAFNSQLADVSAQTRVAQTYPYNVNNNVRFVSLPVQAGYLVINRKFGLQVNAGVSTDLFLQNTITPDGGGLSKTTQGRCDDSPYRSLNFSGLMGTELSYKLGYRYRVSLNPGVRYPFTSVYKSNTGVDATPVTFDVGLRFRYIFH